MTKYIQNKNIVARSVAGENLLVPVNQCTKKVFTLNPVGLLLWDEIAAPQSEEALAGVLMQRYGIERDTALRDVRAFLSEMLRLELVVGA